MTGMKPWQILVFFISVVLTLMIISFVFPGDGLQVSAGIRLKFFNPDELFAADTNYYADISSIIENSGIDELDEEDEILDSLFIEMPEDPEEVPMDTVRVDADSIRRITHLIEFSRKGKEGFHVFFRRLSHVRDNGELIRILHYGDSQIETDRMTGFIRNRLQKRFGGSGCGLVPPVPLYKGKMSIAQDHSGEWNRKVGFGGSDTTRTHNSFGALISYASFDAASFDSTDLPWIELKPSPIAYATARKYNEVSLYLSKKNNDYMAMDVLADDSLIDRIEVADELDYNKITWKFGKTPSRFRMVFGGSGSPELYGISLDNHWGVAVDNIPLRGSAGLVFSKNDTVQLRQMYEDLNVGLIILQFGGNVVPYMKNASRYEEIFKRELKVIRSLCPGTAVLVIGPSDMSIRDNGKYITNPNLEKIRDAMRRATLDAGYAFWDMYEAMGGKNSMPSWVFAEPSLAISDFVHFNTRGARIIAEMLYNAIIYEYDTWEHGN